MAYEGEMKEEEPVVKGTFKMVGLGVKEYVGLGIEEHCGVEMKGKEY